MEDLYGELGVGRGAGVAEIRDAYKKAARQHHPDKGGDPEKFKRIQRAHEILTDDDKRRTYDLTGSTEEGGANAPGGPFPFPFDIGSMFGMFPGAGPGGRPKRQRGEKAPPKVDRVPLSLGQFYRGHKFELKFKRQKFCTDCKGSGFASHDTCRDCRGTGTKSQTIMMGPMMMQSSGPCSACGGEGTVGSVKCSPCSGGGRLAEEKVLNAVVTPGMATGEVLKFEEACSDTADFARAGDVHIVLEEAGDENGWTRKGIHLEIDVDLGLGEGLVGKKVVLAGHPKGEDVTVEVPAATMNGERLMFAGLGMPKNDNPGSNGNLYVTVHVHPRQGEREKIRDEGRAYLASLFGIAI
jgi:DnaJ-class molecular chaperone